MELLKDWEPLAMFVCKQVPWLLVLTEWRSVFSASNSPIGIFLSAFLFGALSVGAPGMSISDATHVGTPPELIKVVTALIIFFVGAHYIIEHYIKPRKKVEGGQ